MSSTAMKGRAGKHLRGRPADHTVQSKISTEPPLPCERGCGREASTSRKDKLCDNCGAFADRGNAGR